MNEEYTVDWFDLHIPVWRLIFGQFQPRKILEIGSFEGRSTTWMIRNVPDGAEIHCIDAWGIFDDVENVDMSVVERRFENNIAAAETASGKSCRIVKTKSESFTALSRLICDGHADSFDLIYVDGSHRACDVLSDLVFACRLLRNGGILICDDYLWRRQGDGGLEHEPRIAIDAVAQIFRGQLHQIAHMPISQAYFQKRVEAAKAKPLAVEEAGRQPLPELHSGS